MSMIDFARKAIEKMYKGKCDVIERQKITDPITKKTAFAEVPIIMAQPCRLSFKSIPTTGDGNTASQTQETKLFVAPNVTIPSGSKIIVTQDGITTAYANSSTPATYETHQEITLKLFDRWS